VNNQINYVILQMPDIKGLKVILRFSFVHCCSWW